LDSAAKDQLKKIDPLTNTGYVGLGEEALNRKRRTDLKEAFNFRSTSVQNGDLMGTPELFQSITTELWDDLKHLGSKFADCCALALGLERDYFSKTLDIMDLCTLRMLHYPPCDPDIANSGLGSACAIRLGEHTDFGIFTFLFVHDFHDESSLGLQMKNPGEKTSWNDVVFDEDSLSLIDKDETCALIVNTGALMARWTNNIWTATAHRVIVAPKAFSYHRYSIAMFFDPDKEVVCSVHPNFVTEGEKPKYPDIKSIDFLLMKLREAQGVKT
jgi:isopenicillin N synthase-like dioxygenase